MINTIAHGNESDDTLYSSISADRRLEQEILRGGKGDDRINPIELVFDSDGNVDVDNTEFVIDFQNNAPFNLGTGTRKYYGGEGDDEIWGATKSYGE